MDTHLDRRPWQRQEVSTEQVSRATGAPDKAGGGDAPRVKRPRPRCPLRMQHERGRPSPAPKELTARQGELEPIHLGHPGVPSVTRLTQEWPQPARQLGILMPSNRHAWEAVPPN